MTATSQVRRMSSTHANDTAIDPRDRLIVALDLPSVRLEREPRNALGLTRRKELLS